jgi:hypothetical protein
VSDVAPGHPMADTLNKTSRLPGRFPRLAVVGHDAEHTPLLRNGKAQSGYLRSGCSPS